MTIIIFIIFLLIIIGYKLLKNKLYYPGSIGQNNYKKPNDKIKDLYIPFYWGKLHAWFYYIPKKPIIFICHGNAGNISIRSHLLQKIMDKNMSFFIFDYRGYGNSNGFTYMNSTADDALTCYDYLRNDLGIKEEIVPLGESIGAYPAAKLAHDTKLEKLIILVGINSISTVIKRYKLNGILKFFTNGDLDITKYLKNRKGKTLILHSKKDEIVSFENAEENHNSAYDSILVEIDGTHNNYIFDWKIIFSFIDNN